MKNMVVLQKDDNGDIYCWAISKNGIEELKKEENNDVWDGGGTILLDELEEILDKEI